MARIETARAEPYEYSLLQFWSRHLDYPLDVSGKKVLEIGHGGGWYLAEMIDTGALTACGLEIMQIFSFSWGVGVICRF